MTHLEASILGHLEALADCRDCVAPVGVPGHVLVGALQPNLKPRAPIGQHLHPTELRERMHETSNGQNPLVQATI